MNKLTQEDWAIPESLSKNWISKDFSVNGFNPNEPHTYEEWKDWFFSVSDEAKKVDLIPNPLVRANLHQKALSTYLKRKTERGLRISTRTDRNE